MQSGILVYVYRTKQLGDCTTGGISSKYDRMLLILPEGGPFTPSPDIPTIKLVDKEPYFYVIEADVPIAPNGFSGRMMGGNFVYSHDSRFPNRFPIPIHDRQEK